MTVVDVLSIKLSFLFLSHVERMSLRSQRWNRRDCLIPNINLTIPNSPISRLNRTVDLRDTQQLPQNRKLIY